MVRRRFVVQTVLVLLGLLWSAASPVFEAPVGAQTADPPLRLRVPPPKPPSGSVPPGHSRERIHLKLQEGTAVRLRGGGLASLRGDDLSGVAAVLGRRPGVRVERLFGRAEADIDRDKTRAEGASRRQQADLNLYYRLQLPPAVDTEALLGELNALPIVEVAYSEPLPAPMPVVAAAPLMASPSFQGRQGYLGPAPDGVDASFAWTKSAGRGANVTIADIEYAWNQSHEDLGKARGALVPNGTFWDPFLSSDHGTAVGGELVADDNGFGVTGIASDAGLILVNAANLERGWDVANAINTAAARLAPGDVMVIEQQTWGPSGHGYVPVEWVPVIYDAIVQATSAGVIVLEAAGNGSENLDDAAVYGAPFPAGRPDSGAIIVGAGAAPGCTAPTRGRLSFSNHGSRVDLQGWGECVTTAGYGGLQGGSDPNIWYTSGFNGTSSATPIVAGAAAALSSVYQQALGQAPAPAEVRELLKQTGTPQATGGLAGHIGPQPDLKAALGRLLGPTGPITVTSVLDEPDALPGNRLCASAAGRCTLRAAIQESNALAGPDTVVLPAGTYTLGIAGHGEDLGATGDLDVRDSLTLLGAGETATFVDGGQLDRVLHMLNGAQLRASGLTVRNGVGWDGSGAGIHNASDGALTLTKVTLSGNRATGTIGALGGGIMTNGPTRLEQVTLSGNESDRGGGGLAAKAAVTMVDGLVNNNRTTRYGGGIALIGPGTSLNLVNSVVRGNSATVDGGGIYNGDAGAYGGAGTLTLSHVTVDANNDTFGGGGGIMTHGSATLSSVTLSRNSNGESSRGGGGLGVFGGTATLTNVTVSGNTGYQGGAGIAVNAPGQLALDYGTVAYNRNQVGQSETGAGIAVHAGASARLRNSVVAYNHGYSPLGEHGNCSGALTSLGNNQDSGTTCGFGQSTDRVNARSNLAPLADNGGPTETHSLLATSAAIDDGGCVSTIPTDQRGVSRPRDGNRNGTARCDEGALELDPAVPAAPAGLAMTEPWVDYLRLGWQDTSGNESGFRIRRKEGRPDSAAAYVVAGNVGANVKAFTDGGRDDCATYTYQVIARNAAGEGSPTKIVAGTTLLRRPIALAVTATGAGGLRLSWEEYTSKEEVVVVQRKAGAGAFSVVGSVGPNVTSFQDVGLVPGTTYSYQLQAFALGCTSRISDPASATAQ
jgi:serine protease